ncbi:hypothetical protein [Streptoalloteichus hindustanus]|uniref:Secreted protein n=1 Tax=Streptoalloteichus hindustanus TaxID=2017 RepID=A0A1M4XQ69_STRHI|nr:hypothetical protein [Streptoalloteichus hindustanus]SHE95423.1 hypothetical protein SAMN05444320_10274 [Streptoalloteichus hindustanus]
MKRTLAAAVLALGLALSTTSVATATPPEVTADDKFDCSKGDPAPFTKRWTVHKLIIRVHNCTDKPLRRNPYVLYEGRRKHLGCRTIAPHDTEQWWTRDGMRIGLTPC